MESLCRAHGWLVALTIHRILESGLARSGTTPAARAWSRSHLRQACTMTLGRVRAVLSEPISAVLSLDRSQRRLGTSGLRAHQSRGEYRARSRTLARSDLPLRPPERDSRPVTMRTQSRARRARARGRLARTKAGRARPGHRGASLASSRVTDRRPAAPHAPATPHRRHPSRRPSRRPGRGGLGTAGASVRGVPGLGRSRDRREGRRVPDRRRPVRLEHPADAIGRSRRRRAQAARRRPDPDRDHPRHARRLRPGVALPGPRPRGACRLARRTTTSSPS